MIKKYFQTKKQNIIEKNNKKFYDSLKKSLEVISRVSLSSLIIILFFFMMPIIIEFTNEKTLISKEYKNNSKIVLIMF